MIRLYRTPKEIDEGMGWLKMCAIEVMYYPLLKVLSENAIMELWTRNCVVEYSQVCFELENKRNTK